MKKFGLLIVVLITITSCSTKSNKSFQLVPIETKSSYWFGFEKETFLVFSKKGVKFDDCSFLNLSGEVLYQSNENNCSIVLLNINKEKKVQKSIKLDIGFKEKGKINVMIIRTPLMNGTIKKIAVGGTGFIKKAGPAISLGLSVLSEIGSFELPSHIADKMGVKSSDFKLLQKTSHEFKMTEEPQSYTIELGSEALIKWFKKKGRKIKFEFKYSKLIA